MAASIKLSKPGICLSLLGALSIAGSQTTGCSAPFHSCFETRTCQPNTRADAGAAGDESDVNAGTGGEGGSDAGRSGNTAGRPEVGGSGTAIADAGSAGSEPETPNAGAAGMADEDPRLCGGKTCAGDAPKCKSSDTGSQCVTCLTRADCSNGGTCDSSNECVCTNRFNGKHCEFQVFRSIGTLAGDTTSAVTCISHDGTVVAGTSGFNPVHAFRSINGGALEFIAEPASLTPSSGCRPKAVDSSGAVLLDCEGKSFLYTTANGAVAIDLPSNGYAADLSLDGKVLVGHAGSQGLRRMGATNSLLGPLQPNSDTSFVATSADGTVTAGYDSSVGGVRWTAAAGLVALEKLSGWNYYSATDVSADGKVIVGSVDPNTTALAIKWSGDTFHATVLWNGQANAVSGDGSVIVGTDSQVTSAWIVDGTGGHAITDQVFATGTPDLGSHHLQTAFGVSDDGKFVVGEGGPSESGWVVHLP